jgi:REP element-mobilizing transposase RayT
VQRDLPARPRNVPDATPFDSEFSHAAPSPFPIPRALRVRHIAGMTTRSPPSGHRALRRGRHSVPGCLHSITIVCAGRERRFVPGPIASAVMTTLEHPDLWGQAIPLCWVLMPDHAHLLVELGSDRSLERLMLRAKAVTSGVARLIDIDAPPLWAPACHDRALRVEDDRRAVGRYLLNNLVRAGLVERIEAYPYWYCAWDIDGDWG